MNILLYTDPHFCQYSSIVRGRGAEFSTRLESCIKSINWAEKLADDTNCDMIVCLGDFFDGSELNAEEISAFRRVKWSAKKHFFVCGNHEMMSHDLTFNSANIFDIVPNCETISKAQSLSINGCELCFLPYVLSSDKRPISEYFTDLRGVGKKIVFSHNDLAGVQMGAFLSKTGFEVNEIENFCDLFLNGHLHNGERITSKIVNLGNLCGQNFSEDAQKYDHCAFVLNTDTLKIACYENPYSLNFYKLENYIPTDLKGNAVITLKSKQDRYSEFKDCLESLKANGKVIEYKILVEREVQTKGGDTLQDNAEDAVQISGIDTVDSLQKFVQFVHENIGTGDLIDQELSYILK